MATPRIGMSTIWVASWASVLDRSCGRQSPWPSGNRSSRRRVATCSAAKSGKSRSTADRFGADTLGPEEGVVGMVASRKKVGATGTGSAKMARMLEKVKQALDFFNSFAYCSPMRTYRQYCGLARALDLVGDRWTLLIVRELLILGPSRYTDLRNGLPGIATNLLVDRLRELEEAGLVEREQAAPPVATALFRLTP